MNQREEYVLQWLDHTINFSLNPVRNQMKLSGIELKDIRQRALEEIDHQRVFLHNGVLSLHSRKKLRIFVEQYHHALVMLLDQCHVNLVNAQKNDPGFITTCEMVKDCIKQLISHVKGRFGKLFLRNVPIPAAYSQKLKNEIKARVDMLSARFDGLEDPLPGIVWKILYRFSDLNTPALYANQAAYIKELICELEKIQPENDDEPVDYVFLEILVRLNFNDPAFIKYYTGMIAESVNNSGSAVEKRNRLLICKKEFNQIYMDPERHLHVGWIPLKKAINCWFKQELEYMNKSGSEPVYPAASQVVTLGKPKQGPIFKVLCTLSADQIGLMLRAMDELKIIQAKSMSAVFEQIVPYLSTPQKSHISWQSVRSKSYSVEENDRKIIIATLESMIRFIREY